MCESCGGLAWRGVARQPMRNALKRVSPGLAQLVVVPSEQQGGQLDGGGGLTGVMATKGSAMAAHLRKLSSYSKTESARLLTALAAAKGMYTPCLCTA